MAQRRAHRGPRNRTFLDLPKASTSHANTRVKLPYGLTARQVVAAINSVYAYLQATNESSVACGYPRAEELMQPAGFSGHISLLFVEYFAKHSHSTLMVNSYPNGHPDLLSRHHTRTGKEKSGKHGIEVKTTRSNAQAHSARSGWIIVVEIACDLYGPEYMRAPTRVLRVQIAKLEARHWNYYGRKKKSKRTPTSSIKATARALFKDIYVHPDREALRKALRAKKRQHALSKS